uniref:vasotocin-neurophysin VT n=1 Tax=Myxine glutinosa TaxID=7769 RepID=UPI00358DEAC1
MSVMGWTLLAAALLAISAQSNGCYIQNCPRGGKRAVETEPRSCAACGLGGQCVGPSICCGGLLGGGRGGGCIVGGPLSAPCKRENLHPEPCIPVGGSSCGLGGICAAPGVCCTDVTCSIDSTCDDVMEKTGGTFSGATGGLASPTGDLLRKFLFLANADLE